MLVDNLLTLSQLTEPGDAYVIQPVSVDSVIDETLRAFATQLDGAAFEVHVDIPLDTHPVSADRRALVLAV